jgi:hypothetical protein
MRFPLLVAAAIIGGAAFAVPSAPAHALDIYVGNGHPNYHRPPPPPPRYYTGRGYDRGYYRGRRIDREDAVHIARRYGIRKTDDIDKHPGEWMVRGKDHRGRTLRVYINDRTGRAAVRYGRH